MKENKYIFLKRKNTQNHEYIHTTIAVQKMPSVRGNKLCCGCLALFLLLFLTIPAFSQDSGFGIGIIVGEPTGISGKLWISGTSAFDCGAAWSFLTNDEASELRLAFHIDYLFHILNIFEIPAGQMAFYCGVGGCIKILDDGIIVGARIPLGLDYFLESVPLDVFLEIVPVMELFPETRFTGNGGIGVRYFF